jgi:hypothetical protein
MHPQTETNSPRSNLEFPRPKVEISETHHSYTTQEVPRRDSCTCLQTDHFRQKEVGKLLTFHRHHRRSVDRDFGRLAEHTLRSQRRGQNSHACATPEGHVDLFQVFIAVRSSGKLPTSMLWTLGLPEHLETRSKGEGVQKNSQSLLREQII